MEMFKSVFHTEVHGHFECQKRLPQERVVCRSSLRGAPFFQDHFQLDFGNLCRSCPILKIWICAMSIDAQQAFGDDGQDHLVLAQQWES